MLADRVPLDGRSVDFLAMALRGIVELELEGEQVSEDDVVAVMMEECEEFVTTHSDLDYALWACRRAVQGCIEEYLPEATGGAGDHVLLGEAGVHEDDHG